MGDYSIIQKDVTVARSGYGASPTAIHDSDSSGPCLLDDCVAEASRVDRCYVVARNRSLSLQCPI